MASAFLFKFIKQLLILCFSIFISFKVATYLLSDGFSPHYLKAELQSGGNPIDEPIISILNQKFSYYGKGSQSFVFVSEDEKYVLKFFRLNRYRLPSFLLSPSMPSFLKEIYSKKMTKKVRNFNNFITSCKIAEELLPEETGLTYLHLTKTAELPKILLEDKLKRPFEIDLNNTYFILQSRGKLLYHYLIECKEKGELSKAETAISHLFQLIKTRQGKGIGDRDAVISKNAGFLNDTPLFFDIGGFYNFTFDDETSHKEVIKISNKLALWLNLNYPALLPCLQEIVKNDALGSAKLAERK